MFFYIVAGVIVLLIVITIFKTACIVPQKQAWIMERLGKYHSTLSAGLHIMMPFIDRIAYKRDLKECAIDVPPQQCVTRDNIIVEVDGLLYLQIVDPIKASAKGLAPKAVMGTLYSVMEGSEACTSTSYTSLR